MAFSEKLIKNATQCFSEALRSMGNDGHMVHLFDLGKAANGEMWSVMIVVAPREALDTLQDTLGKYEPVSVEHKS